MSRHCIIAQTYFRLHPEPRSERADLLSKVGGVTENFPPVAFLMRLWIWVNQEEVHLSVILWHAQENIFH